MTIHDDIRQKMRFDFIDFPLGWAIQNNSELTHDPKCSSQPPRGGAMFLCDCDALEVEWERLKPLLRADEREAKYGG